MTQRIGPEFFFDYDEKYDFSFSPERVEEFARRPLAGIDDLAAFDGLLRLAHGELEEYGTSKVNRLTNEHIKIVLRALPRVAMRASIDFPKLPFRNFDEFYAYWKRNDMSGSWAARRDYLNDVFRDVEDAVYDALDRIWDETLAEAVSPQAETGWPQIDSEIAQMRTKFARAVTDQDHADVGNACIRVLEMLAEVAFDPDKYATPGMPVPNKSQTKIRFELIIKTELPKSDSEHAFKLSSAAVELAQRVKHSPTPSRREAGISADTTILLSNIIRRITSS